MKRTFLNIIVVVLLTISYIACTDKYFDVNTPSDRVNVDDLRMKELLAPVIYNTLYAQYNGETTFGNYTQYFGGYGNLAHGWSKNEGAWDNIYLYALPNIKIIREKAVSQGATHYEAVAKILEAVNIAFATDSWDNIPYTESGKATELTYPTFDTQEAIYTAIMNLLDDAIAKLSSTDNSDLSVGSEDIIYGGDMDKWKRAAYTLKARYQLRLVKKGKAAITDVLTNIGNGFTSNSDNFLMNYPSDEINPWYSIEILSRSTGNYYRAPCTKIINMMNGVTYPFSDTSKIKEDPRLSAIYVNESTGDPWRGFVNGNDEQVSHDTIDPNTYYKDGGYYTTATSPLILITYAEAKFIEAEANFISNGGTETSTGTNTAAYNAYLNGITASMGQIGVDGTDYLADLAINVGEANLMLHHIMKEKYIANILNPETYSDFRRYNFSTNVFKGLTVPAYIDDNNDYLGQWLKRVVYPTSEENANEAVVKANYKEPNVDVWWAQ